MSVSISFTPKFPQPTVFPPQAAATETNSVQQAPPVPQSPARDLIVFWGPGFPRRDLIGIRDKCRELGLNPRVIPIASSAGFSDELKGQLYRGGELGPQTQVLAFFHGGADAQDKHGILVEQDGSGDVGTMEFLSWLRTPPAGMPCGPESAVWRGTVHLHSCQAGRLRDELKPGSAEWNSGRCFAYSSRKDTSYHQGIKTALDLCDFLALAKKDATLLDPMLLAARALGVTGDTVAFLGAGFERPFVARAPREREEAHPEFVLHNLGQGEQCTARISGSQLDRSALLAALHGRRACGDVERRHMMKLHNVFCTRAAREKLAHMDGLLKAYPRLADMRDVNGTSAAKERYCVKQALDSKQTIADFQSGAGHPEKLIEALDNLVTLLPDERGWKEDIAGAVQQYPHAQPVVMAWALRNNERQLFLHMLDSREPCAPAAIASEFLDSALRGCPSMAMAFLRVLMPAASMAACMAEGIRRGAQEGVLAEWLAGSAWFMHSPETASVMEAAIDRGMLDFLLSHIAQHNPAAIDPVFQVLKRNERSLTATVKSLYQFAETRGNNALCLKIQQSFPSTAPVAGRSFKSGSQAGGHLQRRLST